MAPLGTPQAPWPPETHIRCYKYALLVLCKKIVTHIHCVCRPRSTVTRRQGAPAPLQRHRERSVPLRCSTALHRTCDTRAHCRSRHTLSPCSTKCASAGRRLHKASCTEVPPQGRHQVQAVPPTARRLSARTLQYTQPHCCSRYACRQHCVPRLPRRLPPPDAGPDTPAAPQRAVCTAVVLFGIV